MALSFTGFKQKLFSLMQNNESNLPYQLVNPNVAGSGWSYGWVHFDLMSTLVIARTTLRDILNNAYSISLAKTLYDAALLQPGSTGGLSPAQKDQIDAALSSTFGKQAVDNATSVHLDNLITWAKTWGDDTVMYAVFSGHQS